MQLDQMQEVAVTTDSPKAMVIAGAGSGKTRVLTERIVHLIKERKVSGYEIMAFSFTRKASNEIRDRLYERLPEETVDKIEMGTMHALAYGYLRRFGDALGYRPNTLTVYSPWEEAFLIKEIAKDQSVFKKKWMVPRADIGRAFKAYYDQGITPEPGSKIQVL